MAPERSERSEHGRRMIVNTVLRWPVALHTGPLRCFVGLLCATTGALMLVAPHQFATPVYASIRPHLNLWGIGFVLAGVGLLGLIGFSPGRGIRIAVDLFGGGALLILGFGFAREGGVAGAVFYGVLGLATVFAAFVPTTVRRHSARSRDLHIITVGAAATLIGASMLALPDQFGASYDAIRSTLPLFGIAFLASGAAAVHAIQCPEPADHLLGRRSRGRRDAHCLHAADRDTQGVLDRGRALRRVSRRAAGYSMAGAAARATGGHLASRAHRPGAVRGRNVATDHGRVAVRSARRSGRGCSSHGAAPGHR